MGCIFCAIAAGDVPSARVYEDEHAIAFLDVQPLREGHTLVIPREHAHRLADCQDTTAAALVRATRRVTTALHAELGTEDATIAINDGPHAGQEVPHVHIHIVPRRAGDGGGPVHALFSKQDVSQDPEQLARALQSRVGSA